MMSNPFHLGRYTVLPRENRLRDGETTVQVEPKVMEVLLFLAKRKGEVVSREELIEEVWGGVCVTDHVLSRCISELRKALGDDPRTPSFVETIRKRGYRLIPRTRPWEESAPFAEEFPPFETTDSEPTVARDGLVRVGRSRRVPGLLVLSIGIVLLAAAGYAGNRLLHSLPPAEFREVSLTSLHGSELDPSLSPDGHSLAFSWSGESGDNYDIYIKDLGTEAVRRLTTHPAEDKNPCWSADGTWIAFVRGGTADCGLFVVPSRGGLAQEVSPTISGNICDLIFSPGGNSLLFVDRPSRTEPFSVFELDLLSRERTQLTSPPSHYFGDRDLAVSPDGQQIVFARAETIGIEDLFTMRIKHPGKETQLTFDRTSITGIEWMVNGNEVIYSSRRDGHPRLWRMNAGGGKAHPIISFGDYGCDPMLALDDQRLVFERSRFEINIWRTQNDGENWSRPECLIKSTRWDWMPKFGPHGERIAFLSDRGSHLGIWLADSEGKESRRITTSDELKIRSFDWSPDGKHLAIEHRDQNGRSDLSLMTLAPTDAIINNTRLTQSPANETNPQFSRDGQSLLFVSDQSGDWQLWRMNLDGKNASMLTREGAINGKESWDGRSIYFCKPHRLGIFDLHLDNELPMRDETSTPGIRADFGYDVFEAGILTFASDGNPSTLQLIFHDIASGKNTHLALDRGQDQLGGLGLTLSPDGNTLLFARIDRRDSDIIMIQGFR